MRFERRGQNALQRREASRGVQAVKRHCDISQSANRISHLDLGCCSGSIESHFANRDLEIWSRLEAVLVACNRFGLISRP